MPRSCSCSFPVRNQRARARSCAALSRASAGVVRSAALRAHSDVAVSPSNCPAPVRPAHPMGSQQSDSSSGNAAHGALDKERNNPALPFCTRAELRRHRTATDCWMAIHGLVFNVTGLIPSHPGAFGQQRATMGVASQRPAIDAVSQPPRGIGSCSPISIVPPSLPLCVIPLSRTVLQAAPNYCCRLRARMRRRSSKRRSIQSQCGGTQHTAAGDRSGSQVAAGGSLMVFHDESSTCTPAWPLRDGFSCSCRGGRDGPQAQRVPSRDWRLILRVCWFCLCVRPAM